MSSHIIGLFDAVCEGIDYLAGSRVFHSDRLGPKDCVEYGEGRLIVRRSGDDVLMNGQLSIEDVLGNVMVRPRCELGNSATLEHSRKGLKGKAKQRSCWDL